MSGGMERTTNQTNGETRELSKEESREMFDRQAQRYLGISGDEFLRAWDAEEYGDPDDRSKNAPGVMRLAMLLPFVR
ncbi:MAG: hypothetical protein M3R38_36920 [Actinomycetota bacterium]|nr:hypothetical protein [Actinomycetota bacterium]